MANHYAYELNDLKTFDLIEGIHVALEQNHLKNFKMAGSKIRDLIHGVPCSFSDCDFSVSQMEVYLGCARVERLHERFTKHRDFKKHTHGLIVGTCDESLVGYIEKSGIRLLKKLKDAKKLCVANCVISGYKDNGNDDIIILYLTWKVDRRIKEEWNPPNKNERDQIYKELLKESKNDLQNQPTNWREHIRNVISEIHKKTAKETVYWAKLKR